MAEKAMHSTGEYASLRSLNIRYLLNMYFVKTLSYSLHFHVCNHAATAPPGTHSIPDISAKHAELFLHNVILASGQRNPKP